MSVIKLTLPEGESAVTGKQVSFLAPCDCTGVTGLQINNVSYSIVDALGTAISSLGSIFSSGSMVSVILDCSSNKAYIQNASSAGKAPTSHASNTTTYGASSASNYGHVRLSDSTSSTSSTSGGYAATPKAVKTAYDLANGKEAKHTTTTASLAVASWSSLAQTVSVTGVTASNTVIVSPDAASHDAYCKAGVYCSAQAAGKLTFKCTTNPTAALTVNIVIMGG